MKRILIIRLSAIGDVIMASGLIPALRNTWPGAHIAWLVEPQSQDLLRHNPRLDEVIVWPRNQWRQLWKARRYRELFKQLRHFIGTLRERRFDLVLDAQGLLKSGVWAWLSGAKERIGLGSREGSQYLMTRVLSRATQDRRIGSEYLHLARTLGLETGNFPMDIAVAAHDAESAERHCRTQGITPPYAVFCPFTTRPQKHWFEDRWAALSQALPTRLGMNAVLLGGPSDREAAARIAAAGHPALGNLVGRTNLGEAAAVIRNARLLIGVDTGLTHLGIAFAVPTLALFGATRPYLDPATPRARILYHPLACSPCRWHPTCDGAFTCMQLHTVENLVDSARSLLAASP
ncbi:MAG: glycosyltransferase family 9 protein [Gammaproteobacteria bacterium]|nr:glycosyltransferase family 9 protein [Gammaproteobacteria bacterium]MCP5424782.1 glycosyltransferase family 9 protein [Gammaproteobacteria bacterium]MCP5458241.1 glycosyltransferase family 9 protein [Gammaproteobacteria bacterium]